MLDLPGYLSKFSGGSYGAGILIREFFYKQETPSEFFSYLKPSFSPAPVGQPVY